ncbi:hypothetical protein C2E25_05690 [Geothermobacter hydrogeniphilus]|uniref:Uncharacterized protein n=1 Tax=Geothermobacter hydrogeniphilus TaxID=1969733 RepID=A0A2K2HBU0_9BACT|nr:hypothetical protein [Geothermobacter hydrogeniphilus]PNU20710.1 hypothetical protein C2E25_05690 [Geothermobacter hydrogeniphilus]
MIVAVAEVLDDAVDGHSLGDFAVEIIIADNAADDGVGVADQVADFVITEAVAAPILVDHLDKAPGGIVAVPGDCCCIWL